MPWSSSLTRRMVFCWCSDWWCEASSPAKRKRCVHDWKWEREGVYLVTGFSGVAAITLNNGVAATNCKQLIGQSLVLMGEIGGNDYNHALVAGKSIDEVETYVPFVINTIISAVNELIELGAQTLVIPGNLPIGCSAAYLTIFYGSDNIQYDNSTGCIITLNKFAEYHNELLQRKLQQIRVLHPEVNIIYADYYNAAMQFFRSPNKFGFTNGALKACCGGGGPFNYNPSIDCADSSSTSCAQPDTYVNWDGLHLTEAAYKVIFKSIYEGSYTTPQFNTLCPISTLQWPGGLLSSI
ncbi:unnamed protein product [Lactuca virosa]|uniref:Sinapine esterase n=1 Tax=Lactuca virosa TaxID=75947 RepID=A0AAU9NN14_9ASTR|nr:unnamed protein product [Lactuca virosa]